MKAGKPVAFLLGHLACIGLTCAAGGELERRFKSPPREAFVHAWWHWVGYNVSSNGISRDLTAMKSAGIGGATVFTIASHGGPWCGEPMENQFCAGMSYMNDVWWSHLKFAAEEADRLGLELGMHICPGFSVSGGTWISPEHAMKGVVWTKCPVPARPPEPEHGPLGWYREIGETSFDGWNYRFGYCALDNRPTPSPDDIQDRALECDKMSAEAVKIHLDHVLVPLKTRLGKLVGKSFRHVTMDSYESGPCSWTQSFRGEFCRRRGYDPLPFLPVLAGAEMPRGGRFKEDLLKTINELVSENHYRQIKARCAEMGLQFQLEPYGNEPLFDDYDTAARADLPMQEFWVRTRDVRKFGAYSAHVGAVGRAFARKTIGAEAFTGMPSLSKWTVAPCDLKDLGDATFARGFNRLVLHRWVHQPFDPRWAPGNTFGYWGTHFGEGNTWFEPGKTYFAYLNRCQAMLQHGEPIVDAIAWRDRPEGQEFDAIGDEAFVSSLSVLPGGDVALPSGRRYRLVRLPPGGDGGIPLAVARKLRDLVEAGAAVWAPRRFVRASGLSGGDAADAEVRQIATLLWDMPRPRVFTSGTMDEAFAALKVPPPIEVIGGQKNDVRPVMGCARKDGDVPYFFVCNTAAETVSKSLAFRVAGRIPEMWNPETGETRDVTFWRVEGERTILDFTFAPLESMFVVFRRAGEAPEKKPPEDEFLYAVGIDGDWKVSFEPDKGAPATAVNFDGLQSLSKSPVPGIRFFSGTAIYEKDIATKGWSRKCSDGVRRTDLMAGADRFVLDLGKVSVTAEVSLNGRKFVTLWHAPYCVDITEALVDGPHNRLVVKVATTWHNRLVGDELEPDDCEWGEANARAATESIGRPLKRIPDFVLRNTERPSKGRVGFSTWNYFGVNSPLQDAGLIGPVTIEKYRMRRDTKGKEK